VGAWTTSAVLTSQALDAIHCELHCECPVRHASAFQASFEEAGKITVGGGDGQRHHKQPSAGRLCVYGSGNAARAKCQPNENIHMVDSIAVKLGLQAAAACRTILPPLQLQHHSMIVDALLKTPFPHRYQDLVQFQAKLDFMRTCQNPLPRTPSNSPPHNVFRQHLRSSNRSLPVKQKLLCQIVRVRSKFGHQTRLALEEQFFWGEPSLKDFG
jgi:hypothetical protein